MNDNLVRGCACMVGATILFSTSDTIAKYLVGSIPAIEIAWIRYSVFVLLALLPVLARRGGSFRSRHPWLQILRGMGVVLSALFFILSLGRLPIADATALNFVTPLLITLLAIPVLKEVVRPRAWIAIAVGFAGMLIVVRPGVGGLNPAALLVLASALAWCVAMILTRVMGGGERPLVTLLWTAVSGWLLLTALLPFALAPMTARQVGLAMLLGLVASGAQFLAILAYRYARPTVVAPLSYGQLIWSATLGYLVFGTMPDRWVVVGAVIIAVSGFTVINDARKVGRSEAGARPAFHLAGQAAGQQPADQA